MSAIFGIVRHDGEPVMQRDLARMGATMKHRVPDGQRLWVEGPVGLGHGLMRITVEDRFEAQPLIDDADEVVVVADARLDNREALAEQLGIAPTALAAKPDSALILSAYRRWGEDCAEHLLGDFVFAIWDHRSQRLLLGRDQMGQRYVHYHVGEHFFAFATEAKALLALPEIPRAIDDVSIVRHLTLEPLKFGARTFFAGIAGLPGGTTLAVGHGRADEPRRYWEIAAGREHIGRDDDYYVRTYRALLAEAVGCRVRRLAHRPGLLLSGGFDSGAIAALSADALPNGMPLVTATSSSPEGKGGRHDARRGAQVCVAAMPHLDHHWFVRSDESPLDRFESRAHALESPPDLLDPVIDALMQRLRTQGCRLVMDGVGGDATLNPRTPDHLARLVRTFAWGSFLRELRAVRRHEGTSYRLLLGNIMLMLTPNRLWSAWRRLKAAAGHPPGHWRHRVRREVADAQRKSGLLSAADPLPLTWREDPAALRLRMLRFLRDRACPNLALHAAANGMVLTRPMIDKRLVEFALAIPEHLFARDGRQRDLARRALRDVLPGEFQHRRSSQEHFDEGLGVSIAQVAPEIERQIAELGDVRGLHDLFDFSAPSRRSAAESAQDRAHRLRALLAARYFAWFNGSNL